MPGMKSALIDSPILLDDCREHFEQMKSYKPVYRFVSYHWDQSTNQVGVHKAGLTGQASYQDFLETFPANDPAWCSLNFQYRTKDGGKRNKLVFVHWCPNDLVRDTLKESAYVKMMSLSCMGALKKQLDGTVCFVQADDLEGVQYETILEKVSRHEREPIDYDWREE